MMVSRLTERQCRIVDAYDMRMDIEPDISTERLLAMVSDDVRCGIDEIVEALIIDREDADNAD